jgi:hypothetical protein
MVSAAPTSVNKANPTPKKWLFLPNADWCPEPHYVAKLLKFGSPEDSHWGFFGSSFRQENLRVSWEEFSCTCYLRHYLLVTYLWRTTGRH